MSETLRTIDGRPVLRIERRLAHRPEKVWRALTEPEQLSQWYPFGVTEMELRVGGTIHFDNGQGMTMTATIVELDPPRVFAFSEHAPPEMVRESDDLVHFELRPDGDGCLLIFTHTFDDRPAAASYATGWGFCLGALEAVLDGRPVAWPEGTAFAERHDAYLEALGLTEGSVEQTAAGWTVRFERQLTRPVDQVWAALTESSEPPEVGGPAPLRFTNGFVPAGPVSAVKPPRLLEYEWQVDSRAVGRVRWELSDGPGGARLVLTQSGPSDLADRRATALAAWHTHLELLADHLRGATRCWPEGRTEALTGYYAEVLNGLART